MCSSFLRAMVSLEEKTGVLTHTHGENLCCKAVRLKQQQCVLVNYKCIFKTNFKKKQVQVDIWVYIQQQRKKIRIISRKKTEVKLLKNKHTHTHIHYRRLSRVSYLICE